MSPNNKQRCISGTFHSSFVDLVAVVDSLVLGQCTIVARNISDVAAVTNDVIISCKRCDSKGMNSSPNLIDVVAPTYDALMACYNL
jgi:hypothetical protein